MNNQNNFLTKQTNASGLIYFGRRYYDPRIGRFITPDPLGMVDELNGHIYADSVGESSLFRPNLYIYVNNDPVNLVDLWGLCPEEPGLEPAPWWLDPSDLTFIVVSGGLGSGPEGWLFGRNKIGLLNSNDFLRIGWSWKGSSETGKQIFRIAVGSKRLPFHWHFP